LNVQSVSDVGQTEINTAELLGRDHIPFEVEIAIAKRKEYKFPGSDQIPAELSQAGVETLLSVIHKVINLLLYQFTRKAIKLTVVIIVGYHSCYGLN
jgi:hypothetical protein